MKFRLMPREPLFFRLLKELANKASESATVFRELIDNWSESRDQLQKLGDLEHACDQIVHEIMMRLNKTFVTPIDREDIHLLAKRLDDLVDIPQALSERMYLFNIEKASDNLKEMAALFERAVILIAKAVSELDRLKSLRAIPPLCIEIHTLENQGDRLFEKSLAKLFQDKLDPLEVIKNKEIYDFMEQAIDRCEDIADILWGIVVKYG